MNWIKSALSTVAGTQEPVYGPEAIQSVAKQAEETPYRELTKDDLKWKAMQWTSVETQTFYLISDSGDLAFLQLLYSNVAGIHTTVHFNAKIFSKNKDVPHVWCTDPISNYMFDEDMLSFGGDNIALTLNEEGTAYTLKSAVNEDCLVNLTIARVTPGFCVGKDGTSTFGTDPANPWGSMRHVFWPRCEVEGTIVTKDREVDFTGRGFFAHALQGMKPHHLAARWNFANFQGPTYSATLMEFTTPASYGDTVVTVGGIVNQSEIITASASCTATHLETATDSDNEWPEPTAVKYTWAGKTKDGQNVDAVLEGPIGEKLDRVDIMAEVPGFIKSIIGSVAGTKPYVYQYSPPHKLTLKLRIGDTEITEEGTLYCEATFIS